MRDRNSKLKTQNAKPWLRVVTVFVGCWAMGAAWGAGGTTRPVDLLAGIPIGRETTYVTGPRNADGTIDYVAAANAMAVENAKPDDNAASVFLEALPRGKSPFLIPSEIYRALGIAIPDSGSARFQFFGAWLSANHPDEKAKSTDDDWSSREVDAERKPWTRKSNPMVAEWLDDEQPFLELLKEGSKRKYFYTPLVSNKQPPTMLDAMTNSVWLNSTSLCTAFTARIYEEIGDERLPAAIDDLQALSRLGILTSHTPVAIHNLSGAMTFVRAMRGYRWIALRSDVDARTLKEIAENLGSEYSATDSSLFERFASLDLVMQTIRGDEQQFLRLEALIFGDAESVNEGNLQDADWGILLRTLEKRFDELEAATVLPRKERKQSLEKMATSDEAAGLPTSFLVTLKFDAAESKKRLELFLKRREEESINAYSQRMAMLFVGDAKTISRVENLFDRPDAERRLTEATIALARFHQANGKWPESLEALVPDYLTEVPMDPFAGQALRYHQNGDDFILYSVGLNEKDDGGVMDSKGGADDLAVTSKIPVSG